jgi:hypothetical protein
MAAQWRDISFELKHGMCYWSGGLAKPGGAVQPDDDGYEEEINAMTQAQVTAICGATQSPAALKQMLDEPAVRDNTQKRNIVRKRLAECGEYCANCPKTDKLLQFHCKYGHCSWRKTLEILRRKYTDEEIRKEFGSIAAVFCESCALSRTRKANRLHDKVPAAAEFGDVTYTDIAGRFKERGRATGYYYEICFIDSATGYATLYGLRTQQSKDVAEAVDRYFA